MSTDIITIKAQYEKPEGGESTYKAGSIHVTRFYGGTERGPMLQVGICNGLDFTHVHLTKKQVKKLRKSLKTAFTI